MQMDVHSPKNGIHRYWSIPIWKLLSTNINQLIILIYYTLRRWQGKPEHCCTAQYCSFRFDFDAQISTDIVLWQTKLEQEISTFYWKIIYQNLSLEFIGYHLSRNGGALSFPGLGRDVIFCKVPPGRTGGVLGALIFSSSRRFAVERQFQIKSGRHAQATDRKQGRPLGWRFDLWVPNWVNVDLWSIMPPPCLTLNRFLATIKLVCKYILIFNYHNLKWNI